MPMFLFDLMKTSILTRWLDRIARLHLPLKAGAVPRSGLVFVAGGSDREWLKPADAATLQDEEFFSIFFYYICLPWTIHFIHNIS